MILGLDLGKTSCRVAVAGHDDVVEVPGAPGLAEAGGVEAAGRAIEAAVGALDVDREAISAACVGAAGAEAAPEAIAHLATHLARLLPGAEVAVTSDAVTAHAGALRGRAGSVLAVGTGIVALALDHQGARRSFDGWGPWLGDDGSGAWIGREALRAVLAERDGLGPATTLTEVARVHFGDPTHLARAVATRSSPPRALAALVPDVAAAAEHGDAAACDVLDRAVACWVRLAEAATRFAGRPALALAGGLTQVQPLVSRLSAALPDDVEEVPADGTPLDGALLLAGRRDLPHEAAVVRFAPGPTPAGDVGLDVDTLETEQVRRDLDDLDTRDAEGVVAALLAAEAQVPAALAAAAPALAAAVRLATAALGAGGRLIYVGAGTPGRLAAVDAAECPPTFGVAPDRVVALSAGGDPAVRAAVEGAEDDADAGVRDLAALAPGPDDLVVGIAASGRTPYVLSALREATRRGAATVAVVNNAGGPIARVVDVAVEVLTGPETVAGSTRLKAGTAQKIALNVISTAAMIGTGHTYGAWMVDVVAANEKLRRRARRILREAAGVDDATAAAALADAEGRTKPALVSLLAGVSAAEATRRLTAHGGRVRAALED